MSAIWLIKTQERTNLIILQCVQPLNIRNSETNIRSLIKDTQCNTNCLIVLSCSVIVDARLLEISEDTLERIEKWFRNASYVLYQKRSESLGLTNRK